MNERWKLEQMRNGAIDMLLDAIGKIRQPDGPDWKEVVEICETVIECVRVDAGI